ncbi:hypothetical protein GT037_005676 [Alternaria burnsii]|uniref:Methyltransferase n=1 Tax=Alternaria burnsii TaxID=1187904 RepID=A0A8H7B6R0_9PLEO|nr:uncharacterized protein GT037_005676 [Alternaria burnsii]KAF7676171.1 hypothetical protein GT037_005676 [Alternaria burnsii]
MTSPRDEVARFSYLQWQPLYETEKPFQVFSNISCSALEQRSTNLHFIDGEPQTIHDIRGRESEFGLDRNGFMIRKDEMREADLTTEEGFRRDYLPHIENMMKEHVADIDHMVCFDWGFRKNVPLRKDRINVNDRMQLLEPARQVHCDQSPAGALQRLQRHAPEYTKAAYEGRLRIINVWRPLNHPVEDNALAVCDGQTIEDRDLVEADHITRLYLGRTMYGLQSPQHKWYYLNHQCPNELLFIKIFDSDSTVPAPRSLHASFDHSQKRENAPPRESVEVRFLVITEARQ